jgi:hypothetical protein
MKTRPVVIELLHAYERTEELTVLDRQCAGLQTPLNLADGKIKDESFNGVSFIIPL